MLGYIRKVEREDRKLIFIFDNYKVILESNSDDVWEINNFFLREIKTCPILNFKVVYNETTKEKTGRSTLSYNKFEIIDNLISIKSIFLFSGIKSRTFENVRYLEIFYLNKNFPEIDQKQYFKLASCYDRDKLRFTFTVELVNLN